MGEAAWELAAFRVAPDCGAGGGLDVRPGKDGVLVVFHDSDLKRMTGSAGELCAATFAELRKLRFAEHVWEPQHRTNSHTRGSIPRGCRTPAKSGGSPRLQTTPRNSCICSSPMNPGHRNCRVSRALDRFGSVPLLRSSALVRRLRSHGIPQRILASSRTERSKAIPIGEESTGAKQLQLSG
jgi:hypothetical protein